MCAVKKMSPREMKFFIYVIIVLMSIFRLFYVVTIVYNLRQFLLQSFLSNQNVNIVSSFECGDCPRDVLLGEL